ncbi:MAG: nucleotide sugar dehydrogenase [Paracoccaceae bacterium]
MKNITVVGLGYVGLSLAILLARHHHVRVLDIVPDKVDAINQRRSPVADSKAQMLLDQDVLDLVATTDPMAALSGADVVFIATPTNFDEQSKTFDISSVQSSVNQALKYAPDASIVIKSTVPVDYPQAIQDQIGSDQVIFSPEFLREGRAIEDNQNPSRIVVGDKGPRGAEVAELLRSCAQDGWSGDVLLTGPTEAAAVKLFANTYLAMRVAFFNELDSFALEHGLDTRDIIDGVCQDPRIGNGYNNPSFGYGGYCLPKDTKQMQASFDGVPQKLMDATVQANAKRKAVIANAIIERGPKTVGIYRLVMKHGSDNFRSSSIQGVMARLRKAGIEMIVFEPVLQEATFKGARVERDLEVFKSSADVIVANRWDDSISDVEDKVFSRDIYRTD